MSKRLNNYPDPMAVMEKYGADAVRYYLMTGPVVRAENLRFAESGVVEVSKNFINILRNVVSFYALYREHDDGRVPSGEHVLDAWILSRLNETLAEETQQMEAYELSLAARPLQSFVTDLSTWYLRRSRDRMKVEGADRLEAVATLRTVLETFSKMLAPFMPMLAENIYQEIDGGFLGRSERLSVHLEDWLEAGAVDQSVLEKMGEVRAIVSRVLDQREAAGRAIKQALGSVTIWTPSGELAPEYLAVILDEVNVKSAVVLKGELKVELDVTLTPELIREGLAREVVRKVNQLRKDSSLTIEDRIDLKIWSASEEVKIMFAEHGETIKESTLAETIEFNRVEDVAHSAEFRASEQDFWVGF
jgi:isoleucyl-tRNA synthetase